MKSDEARINFVLRFVQTSLGELRPGDWLNLEDDMLAFLGWSPRLRDTLTVESLTPLKEEAAAMFHGIARAFAPRKPGDPEAHLPKVLMYGEVKTEAIFRLAGKGRRGVALGVREIHSLYFDFTEPGRLLVEASLQDSFLFSLLTTLSRLDVTYLRQCPACSRLFYAVHGRQMFCTPQCASRAGTRRFRAKNQKQENERGKENYKKKMKKKLGPNVQVKKKARTISVTKEV